MLKRILSLHTSKIYSLPVLVLMPHSACNCRCVMCDIWKANHNKKELTLEQLEVHAKTFEKLNVKEIVFSGGEALMHSNLWNLCKLLKKKSTKLTLLSTGLLLEKNAQNIVANLDEVIISVDGSSAVHDQIRNIPNGYEKIRNGIAAIKEIKPRFRVTARCVLQRYNYRDFINTVKSAKIIGLDQISFLAADITTSAFNHSKLTEERVNEIALTKGEALEFENILKNSFVELSREYESHFIAERPDKMMRVVQYYRAINGEGKFPLVKCNAPWVSAVIESNGDVMPCFFHKSYGNIHEANLIDILNSDQARSFRKNLDMEKNDVCAKCVCSLRIGLTQMN
jgi:MoaA/NifB/PqqE/SkfB family radical SAM enzyme